MRLATSRTRIALVGESSKKPRKIGEGNVSKFKCIDYKLHLRRFELSQFNNHVRTEVKDTKDQARLERLRDEVKELRRRREQLGDLLIRFGDESHEDLLASLRMTADVSSIWVIPGLIEQNRWTEACPLFVTPRQC